MGKSIPLLTSNNILMRKCPSFLCVFLFCWLGSSPAFADTLLFLNNESASGIILRTNANDLLVLNDYGTSIWPRSKIRKITIERTETYEAQSKERIPNFKSVLLLLNKQSWAANLKQIPATVIDQGIMRNVPYVSFRCGEDFEINVYGDLDHPVGIEAGVYRKLLDDETARSNCVDFISALLNSPEDKKAVQQLTLEKPLTNRGGLTFEITPPTAVDAYGGWWISVYSPTLMNLARASDAELKEISASKAEDNQGRDIPAWTPAELKLARPTRPTIITVTTSFGTVITNAEIVRVNEGVSLVWRAGGAGGIAKLADLPEELQSVFGYDSAKATSVETAEKERRIRQAQQDQLDLQQAQANAAESARRIQAARQETISYRGGYTGGYVGSSSRSSGGSVYVRSYTRKDGTYVRGHTRRR
jgi:hypothetical protein